VEIPFRYRVFYLILRIPNQNRHYFWRTRPNPLSYFFYIRYQTPSFCFFICALLFRTNLFNLFIWSASNCVMKFWSRANIFILLKYYFTTAFFLVPSPEGSERKNPRDPRDLGLFFCNRLFIKIIYNCVFWFRVPRVPSVKILGTLGTLGTRDLFL